MDCGWGVWGVSWVLQWALLWGTLANMSGTICTLQVGAEVPQDHLVPVATLSAEAG